MKILVTGGAGYIGSHTVSFLLQKGYEVIVFDNLIYGHKQSINCDLVVGDLLNREVIKKVFDSHKIDGVIHFAAYAQAGESMAEPAKYFENNIMGGVNLLDTMNEFDVRHIVFSSSCAVYGYPDKLPVDENAEKNPVSVYGETKLMFEKILYWYDKLFNIKNVSLRYFNACGASLVGNNGEDHDPETHIIPLAIQCALGKREAFTVYGNDYNTQDGTNVRDYIHVLDLAASHIKALEYLYENGKSDYFNVGTGKGYSNKQIIDKIKEISKVDFPVSFGDRRPGDPDEVYADNSKIKRILKWKPEYSDLDTIIRTSWEWHKSKPNGFTNEIPKKS